MTEEDFETLGLMVDSLDNGLAATRLPLPAELHVQGMSGIMETVRNDLREFLKGKGFDPWNGQP